MTVPEAEVMVDWAVSKTGSTYRAQDPDRWILDNVFDCSSLWVRAHRAAGVAVPDWVRNTVTIYEWARDLGALVSVAKAVETRGAGLVKGRTWGFGSKGHAAISEGGGFEMAAHGTKSGVHDGPVDAGFYNDGIILPPNVMHYAALDPPIDLAAIAKLLAFKDYVTAHPLRFNTPASSHITDLNRLLVAKALLVPSAPMNYYGQQTAAAVKHLKKLAGIKPTDGKVFGSEAAGALLARAV